MLAIVSPWVTVYVGVVGGQEERLERLSRAEAEEEERRLHQLRLVRMSGGMAGCPAPNHDGKYLYAD